MLTVEQHASKARIAARAAGCADCIHYAPNWARRADALYDAAKAEGVIPGSPFLLADGRMVVVCDSAEERRRLGEGLFAYSLAKGSIRDVWFFEPRSCESSGEAV